MKKYFLALILISLGHESFCWGFYGHKKINYYATFLLPPQMLILYKSHIDYLTEHAVDPDMRRYVLAREGPRHYIDIDHYGQDASGFLPRKWNEAVEKLSDDSLQKYGIVPWWIQTMQYRLTNAFREKSQAKILKLSAELGHYIADAHVPLHANSNHNGQFTNQQGIHGFWESRIPELLAEKGKSGTGWDFFIGKAEYISDPAKFIWQRVFESAAAADTVLSYEKALSEQFPSDQKYSFESRNGSIIRQYSSAYTMAYDFKLNGMVERRMRQAIFAVASFWYTAWVDAGEPDLSTVTDKDFSPDDLKEFEKLTRAWKNNKIEGREHE